MLGARLCDSQEGSVVFNATGSACVAWLGCTGRVLARSEGGELGLRGSFTTAGRVASCVFATLAGRETVCVLSEEGVLELLYEWGAERWAVSTAFNIDAVFPLASGLLLQTSSTPGIYSLMHHLDEPCPVSRLSKSGRGDAFGSTARIVCCGGAHVTLWDSGKLAVYAVYVATDRASEQSYQKAVEVSLLHETAQSFLANQISLYDTFTVDSAPLVESQVFFRRLLIDSEESERPDAGVVSVKQGLVFIRSGSRLKCFRIGSDGLSCRFAFQMDEVSSFSPLSRGSLWMLCRGGALWLCDGERLVANVELPGSSPASEAFAGGGGGGGSGMSMSMEEASDGDSLNASSMMECSPAVSATGGLAMRLSEQAGPCWSFVLNGSESVSRFELELYPRDAFVAEMIELVRELLPGSASVDFLVDFGETAQSMPGVSEWDRLASLIGSLICLSPSNDERSGETASTSWQRIISSSQFAKLASAQMSPEQCARLVGCEYKVFPNAWKAVSFAIRTPATLFRELSFSILLKLHLYYEGTKCDLAIFERSNLLRPLLVMLSKSGGAERFTSHYLTDDPSLIFVADAVECDAWPKHPDAASSSPFHLHRWLIAKSQSEESADELWCGHLPTLLPRPLQKIVQLWQLRFGSEVAREEVKAAVKKRMARAHRTPSLHSCDIIGSAVAEATQPAATFKSMFEALQECATPNQASVCYLGYCEDWSISNLPISIRAVMQSSLEETRLAPHASWPRRLYEMIGRLDMPLQREDPLLAHDFSEARISWGDPELRESERSAGVLITHPVSHLRFPQDRRLQEVQRLLGTWAKVNTSVPQLAGVSDHDYLECQNKAASSLVVHMGARCVGRGMLAFGADNFSHFVSDDASRWEIKVPTIPRSVRIVETRTAITVDETGAHAGSLDWLDFHSGVAAGLRIASGPQISNAWIVYNRPPEGAPASQVFSHAGLLLGLGLNGHLRHLSFVRLFDYLARAHVMTSVGLLLGVSATMCGSMDNSITRLLSIHLPMLHPPASADLEVPPALQAASLIGLGLLYKGSCHRRMTEILISEMDRPPTDDRQFHRESHALSAALALGWVTLGQGGTAATLSDLQLEDRLLRFIVGGNKDTIWANDGSAFQEHASVHHAQNPRSNLVKPGKHANTNLTAGPATLALGLMYLKTNNADVAERIKVPETLFLLNSVRPDFLLLRCLSRSLILWDAIEPSDAWLQTHIPSNLWRFGDPETGREALNSDMADDLPRGRDFVLAVNCKLYCVTGCLMGLGIARAGTQDPASRLLLFGYLKRLVQFRKLCADGDALVAEMCLMNVCVAASLVMAGSGDLELLMLFRTLAMRPGNEVNYGSHMAIGMAIGFLFLGGSTMTLSRTNEAVAALVTSLFPMFPTQTSDNTFHLQALRHLYVLAVKPSCLIAVDAEKLTPVNATARFDHSESVHFSPCLLPESVVSVSVTSDGYIPVTVDCSRHRLPLKVFLQPRTGKSFPTFSVGKWLQETSAEKCGSFRGWNLALLKACGLINAREMIELFAIEADEDVQLIGDYYLTGGSFPRNDCSKAQRLVFLLSSCGMPPSHAMPRDLQCASALDLAFQLSGRVDLSSCQVLYRASRRV